MVFGSKREESKEVSKGKQAPRNLDKENPVIRKAEAYADSIQKVMKLFDFQVEKMKKEINDKLKELDKQGADGPTKEYYVKKIIRKWKNFDPDWREFL